MASLSATPSRLGRYQLRYRIAMGGMGGVYLAKAVGAGGADKVVAVKLLHEHLGADETVVKMFLDEARIASALNHVNVCTTFDFGEQDGVYYLVMEYLEGEPLNRVLKHLEAGTERHPDHPWLIARLLIDAAEGLHAAHQLNGSDGQPLNVVHRDVSPHNIFVTYDGVAKMVDFGIARARERSSSTEAGAFKGKFEYAAPEQIGSEPVDRRTDTWALGVCLFELLSGKRLFQREDYSAAARAVLRDPIPRVTVVNPSVPKVFDAICAKALQREPSLRYQTAREFGRALRDALVGSGTAIDGPTIEEWLEALFPGDRAKRQALATSVRQSSPDAPLEVVPAPLKISDTSTGSKRSYKSSSSSGRLAPPRPSRPGGTNPDASTRQSPVHTPREVPLPPPPARPVDPGTDEVEALTDPAGSALRSRTSPAHQPPRSRGALLVALALLLVVGAGVAVLAIPRPDEPTDAPAVVDEPVPPRPPTVAVVTPPPPKPIVVEEPPPPTGEDAGASDGSAAWVAADEPAAPAVDAGLATKDSIEPLPDAGLAKAKKPLPVKPRATAEPVAVKPPEPPPVVTPPSATKPSKAAGLVHFKTPGGTADVYVDGAKVGTTPLSLELAAGRHTFELKAKGVEIGGTQSLNVSPGSDFNVEVDLR